MIEISITQMYIKHKILSTEIIKSFERYAILYSRGFTDHKRVGGVVNVE